MPLAQQWTLNNDWPTRKERRDQDLSLGGANIIFIFSAILGQDCYYIMGFYGLCSWSCIITTFS